MVELSVAYNVSVAIKTAYGETQDAASPLLLIPIKGNSFTVEVGSGDKKDSAITQKRTAENPGVAANRIAYSAAAVLFALILAWLLFGTYAQFEDPLEKEMKGIMKKHGVRIASAVGKIPVISKENLLEVGSFTDLVTVADEIAQPILYENISEGIHSFYVISDPLVYTYRPGEKALTFKKTKIADADINLQE